MKINSYIDHTLLAADATEEKIKKICDEAKEHEFASVCVNTCWTSYCAMKLRDSDVSVCVVVGFPLGAMATVAKAFEASSAVKDGADEIDMVINLGWLKDGKFDLVERDIREVKKACKGKLLKVIIETCLLTDEEKINACKLAVKSGADFVKTSTGFSTSGAKAVDVKLMRETVGPKIGVKAAGGIHNYQQAVEMIEAGATRIGASCGIAIVAGASENASF
ncbi:MAG: deoxyribose-phosphate aldolase [Sphaerochaetaceae bacterium]